MEREEELWKFILFHYARSPDVAIVTAQHWDESSNLFSLLRSRLHSTILPPFQSVVSTFSGEIKVKTAAAKLRWYIKTQSNKDNKI